MFESVNFISETPPSVDFLDFKGGVSLIFEFPFSFIRDHFFKPTIFPKTRGGLTKGGVSLMKLSDRDFQNAKA